MVIEITVVETQIIYSVNNTVKKIKLIKDPKKLLDNITKIVEDTDEQS